VKTEQLVEFLARGIEPAERQGWVKRLALALGVGLAIAIGLVATLGFRDDIGVAMGPVLLKAGFSAAAAAAILPLALRLMRPGAPLGWRVAAIGVFALACVVATGVALMGAPVESRWDSWMGGGFPWCLVAVPLLAAPTGAGLIWLARGLAPTRLAASGAAIGALAGGIGAMAYSMYCPVDSAAFVATWYALAIALCAAVGAIVGSILLRW
jgi:hypothetical protein